ncbi:alpha/beta fold hydrolase, partial [Amycolatopsis sp. NPDC058278]|uniref:alpha/beta fold hydrolase n=1 Tax=Amycolatopsis sp. NPDC058278 TaxID=3346417 RepID=UPI0036D7A10D
AVGGGAVVVGTLRRGEEERGRFLRSLSEVFTAGATVDFSGWVEPGVHVDLPTYAFQRERYWLDVPGLRNHGGETDSPLWDAIERGDTAVLESVLDVDVDRPFREVLPTLTAWRRRQTELDAADALRYRLEWRPRPAMPGILEGTWLVIPGEGDEWGPLFAEALRRRGATVRSAEDDLPAGVVSGILAGPGAVLPDSDAPVWWVGELEAVRAGDGVIELPAVVDDLVAERVAAAVSTADGESRFLVRGTELLVRRIVPAPPPAPDNGFLVPWRTHGTVLLTGGNRTMVPAVLHWLAEAGAEHVVLDAATGTVQSALAEAGIPHTDLAGSDPAGFDLAELLASTPTDLPLSGVVHLADDPGELPPGPVSELDVGFFCVVVPIDGLWGNGAAQQPLTALAERRRADGRAATTIVWGGGAEEPFRPVPDSAVAGAFRRTFDLGEDEVLLATADWERLAAEHGTHLFALLIDEPVAEERAQEVPTLTGLTEAEQKRLLTEFVCEVAASALGLRSAAEVRPASPFLEIGFTSLASAELASRLARATGLPLPGTLAFGHPTPNAVVEYLLPRLGAPLQNDHAAVHAERLDAMLVKAAEDGQLEQFFVAVDALSRFRPPAGDGGPDAPITLAAGTDDAVLICFPAFIGRSGAHQYARLATAWQGYRDVVVVPQPGFIRGQRLPSDLDELLAGHVETVLSIAGGKPFVLVGHSSGGVVAHEVARRLEDRGTAPSAVVAIDSHLPEWASGAEGSGNLGRLLPELVRRNNALGAAGGDLWGDDWISAMARYLSFDWRPGRVGAPALLVRASEPLSEEDPLAGFTPWDLMDSVIEVPGNHFTVLEDHAAHTAQVIHGWLGFTGGQEVDGR